jgi:hypothetical protein
MWRYAVGFRWGERLLPGEGDTGAPGAGGPEARDRVVGFYVYGHCVGSEGHSAESQKLLSIVLGYYASVIIHTNRPNVNGLSLEITQV